MKKIFTLFLLLSIVLLKAAVNYPLMINQAGQMGPSGSNFIQFNIRLGTNVVFVTNGDGSIVISGTGIPFFGNFISNNYGIGTNITFYLPFTNIFIGSSNGPFVMTGGFATNATDPRQNEIWQWGYNINHANTNLASFYWNLETYYEDTNIPARQQEFYETYTAPGLGIPSFRNREVIARSNLVSVFNRSDKFRFSSKTGSNDDYFVVEDSAALQGGILRLRGQVAISTNLADQSLITLNGGAANSGQILVWNMGNTKSFYTYYESANVATIGDLAMRTPLHIANFQFINIDGHLVAASNITALGVGYFNGINNTNGSTNWGTTGLGGLQIYRGTNGSGFSFYADKDMSSNGNLTLPTNLFGGTFNGFFAYTNISGSNYQWIYLTNDPASITIDWVNHKISSIAGAIVAGSDLSRLYSIDNTTKWVSPQHQFVVDTFENSITGPRSFGGATFFVNAGGAASLSDMAPRTFADTGWAYVGTIPTNTANYTVARYCSASAPTHTFQSNFTMLANYVIQGETWTNSFFSMGLRVPNSSMISASALEWFVRQDWNTNWIAHVGNNGVHSYNTSSFPATTSVTNILSQLKIETSGTNSATFYTNGVAYITVTTNMPGGQALSPAFYSICSVAAPAGSLLGTNILFVDDFSFIYR